MVLSCIYVMYFSINLCGVEDSVENYQTYFISCSAVMVFESYRILLFCFVTHISISFMICMLNYAFTHIYFHYAYLPGRVAQSVTCLATDACLTADPGVTSSIPVRSHTFVEIDHEMISTVILLPSADSFKKGCCQLQAKVCARITG